MMTMMTRLKNLSAMEGAKKDKYYVDDGGSKTKHIKPVVVAVIGAAVAVVAINCVVGS